MKKIILLFLLFLSLGIKSQITTSELITYWGTVEPEKIEKFEKYVEVNHSFEQNFTTWKKENKIQYIKEFWYYTESFYVERYPSSAGISLDESIIDISRYEKYRKETEEVKITLTGFKDILVLIPSNQLIYKP